MISVIMLTYNRKDLMRHMVEDVLAQDYEDFEFLVIDNGSDDKSRELLDCMKRQDSRMKTIYLEKPVSIGKARNIGLRTVTGSFIAYVDDDDRIEPDFLRFLVSLQQKYDADIAMCGADEELDGKIGPQCMFEEEYLLSGEEAVIELLKRRKIRAGTPTKLFRRAILEKFPFDEEALSEDIHTMYKYFSEAEKVALYGIPKYHFIRHGENNSMFTSDISKLTPEMLGEYWAAYRERAKYLGKKYPEKQAFLDYTVWSFLISMYRKVKANQLVACTELLEAMRETLRRDREKILCNTFLSAEEKDMLREELKDRELYR